MTVQTITGSLASAQGAALRGLQMAGSRAAEAATRIAPFGTAPLDAASARGEPGAAILAATADPGRAIADLMVARRAYEANATVLRSTEEATRTLLRRTA